jgi:hypothetical protein
MTDLPPEDLPPNETPPRERHVPDEPVMPRWVPVVIGIILVALAALAVYTGVRYRNPSLTNDMTRARRAPRQSPAAGAPGEPEAGASLIFPGESGDNTPTAGAPVTGRARAEVTGGGAQGITSTVRLWARRGMMTNVTPDDAIVYVNDLPIGQAKQFDREDEIYDFPQPGSYVVRLVAPGYREEKFVITAGEGATAEVARLKVKMVSAPPPAAPSPSSTR